MEENSRSSRIIIVDDPQLELTPAVDIVYFFYGEKEKNPKQWALDECSKNRLVILCDESFNRWHIVRVRKKAYSDQYQ